MLRTNCLHVCLHIDWSPYCTFNRGNTASKWRCQPYVCCLVLSGLSVMLFINQQEYIGSLSQSAGIRFLVHRRDHFPFLEEEGQNAGPGTLSAVKLTLVSLHESLHCSHTLNVAAMCKANVHSTMELERCTTTSLSTCALSTIFVVVFLYPVYHKR